MLVKLVKRLIPPLIAIALTSGTACRSKNSSEAVSEEANSGTETISTGAYDATDLALSAAASYIDTLTETIRPVNNQVTFEFGLTEYKELAEITLLNSATSTMSDNLNLQLDSDGNLPVPASDFTHNVTYTLTFAYNDSNGFRQESSKPFRFKLNFGDVLLEIVDPLSTTKNVHYSDIIVNETLETVTLSGGGSNLNGGLSGPDILLTKFTATGAVMTDAWATPVIVDSNLDIARSLVEGADGSVYVGGTNTFSGEFLRGYATDQSLSFNGTLANGGHIQIWEMASFGGFLYAAATKDDGGGAGNGFDFHIRKIDMVNKVEVVAGNWPVYFNSAATGVTMNDIAYGIYADSSGVYVTGRIALSEGANDKFTVLKYTSDGNFQWQTNLTTSDLSYLDTSTTFVPITANSTHLFVAFEEENLVAVDSDGDYHIKKIDKSTGAIDPHFDYIGGSALDDYIADIEWHEPSQSLALLTTGQNLAGGSGQDWRFQTFSVMGEPNSTFSKDFDFSGALDKAYAFYIDSKGDIWICGTGENYADVASGGDAIVKRISGY